MSPETDTEGAEIPETRPRVPGMKLGVILLSILLAVALAGGGFLAGRAGSQVAPEGVDAGFARDMQTHHRQAVELSFIVRDKTEDPELQSLTYDIINGQAHQAGQMYGWLASWGLSQNSSQPIMAWMGHAHHHGTEAEAMAAMGMATNEQLADLRAAEGVEAEKQFLDLMIVHHEGALEMARYAAEHAERPEVRTLAGAIDYAQTAELQVLNDLRAKRG